MDTKSQDRGVAQFWIAVRTEVISYIVRTLARTPCPPWFVAAGDVAPGVTPPGWGAMRRAWCEDGGLHEDVASDVYEAIERADRRGAFPHDLEERRRFTWTVARRIARRTAGKCAREGGVPLTNDNGEEWFSADSGQWEDTCAERIDREPLVARLAALPAQDREILFAPFEGRELREIAELAQLPAGTIRSKRSRLRQQILQWPEAHRGEGAVRAA